MTITKFFLALITMVLVAIVMVRIRGNANEKKPVVVGVWAGPTVASIVATNEKMHEVEDGEPVIAQGRESCHVTHDDPRVAIKILAIHGSEAKGQVWHWRKRSNPPDSVCKNESFVTVRLSDLRHVR